MAPNILVVFEGTRRLQASAARRVHSSATRVGSSGTLVGYGSSTSRNSTILLEIHFQANTYSNTQSPA
ncbi:hypothetical protein DPMN_073154 [Dreissena polymorpha]|uniref:Uncharacterized protein n=1 Tax=Dreissena polymorpha TaxID=45954 RepID=A0A9D4BYI7_DREPO|nr:hypothetical protein DPMN_073154 [Dreissena polymorpha]